MIQFECRHCGKIVLDCHGGRYSRDEHIKKHPEILQKLEDSNYANRHWLSDWKRKVKEAERMDNDPHHQR